MGPLSTGRRICALMLLTATSLGVHTTDKLESRLRSLSENASGTIGISVIHLETGRSAGINGNERFPMGSTYKIAIAIQMLTLIDQGRERLDKSINIKASDLHPGGGALTDRFVDNGVRAVSLKALLELMLIESDNSAADLVLRLAGGPAAVTARMRSLGIRELRVDRSTIQLFFDLLGLPVPAES